MATREELRKKAVEEVRNRNNSNSLSDARAKAVEEVRNRKSSFYEPTKNVTDPIEDESSSLEAFGRSTAVNALPLAGGLALGSQAALAGGAVAGPLGALAGFIGGGVVGSIISRKAQDKVLEVTKGEEWKRNLDQSIAEDRKSHPLATLAGESIPQLIAFKPSPSTLKQAFNFSKRVLTDNKSVTNHIKTLEGKTELDALMNVAIGSGIDISMETYQQAREGDFNAVRIIASGVIGGVISDPNKIGVKMGFKSSGDAVINEYDEFGSKTPAAKIITHNETPIIDRSTDKLVIERMELSAIMRGDLENNRFTEPRILQAERIAGTIDKDVTADSTLNIYRLDGRSGTMRPGERVTANPHIADVYGGRINPESTVKAGDLVRTSQGDYIYIPKEDLQARPKLPPVAMAVDKNVRTQVTTREALTAKSLKARGKEAIRQREEPARLAKEKADKIEKQQAESDAKYDKEIKDAEASAVRLEENMKKTEVAKQAKVAEESKRIVKEKISIEKAGVKEKESIEVAKRKELDEALLAHTERKTKLNTPKQKANETIRNRNKRARIIAKAAKAKKAVTDKVKADKNKVTDATEDIKTTHDKDITRDKDRIKELRKEKKRPVVEDVVVKKTGDTKQNKKAIKKVKEVKKQTVKAKAEAAKVKEEKTTLIGTKKVKSESVIKNAVQDARESSKVAQELDQDVTHQMGTTFVEQTKLSSELIVEKGFEGSMKFAKEASDSELAKLGIDRSGLYTTLLKTASREGQFAKYRDEFEELALLTADAVSAAAQKSSLHRMATQNDPFRRVADAKKALIENEKKLRKSVFTKEVDELHAKIKEAGTEEDMIKVIKDNLC